MIELMVVVAIVAILAVLAAPSYRDMNDRFRVRGAADDVLSVLSSARSGAVKSGLDTEISVTTGSSWCVGATSATVPTGGARAGSAAPCNCSTASTCVVAGQQVAVPVGKHPGVSMGSGGGFIYDAKLGTVISSTGALAAAATPIVLTSPTGRYDVRVGVTPLGQATLCTPTGKPAMAGVEPC